MELEARLREIAAQERRDRRVANVAALAILVLSVAILALS